MAHDGKTSAIVHDYPNKAAPIMISTYAFWNMTAPGQSPKASARKSTLPEIDEMTPYMASDGVTMYFSSNRDGGLGDNDIWMTKRLDKTWTKWSDPVNLGSPINTDDWDAFFLPLMREENMLI